MSNVINNQSLSTRIEEAEFPILLGVFTGPYFDLLKHFYENLQSFHTFSHRIEEDFGYIGSTRRIVEKAICEYADLIVFCLDRVEFPLSPISVTCLELNIICKDEKHFDKTIFLLEGEIVEFKRELGLNIYI